MEETDHGQNRVIAILGTGRARLAMCLVVCVALVGLLLMVYTRALPPIIITDPPAWDVPDLAMVDDSVKSIAMGWATELVATDNQGRDTRGVVKGYGLCLSVSPAGSDSDQWQRIVPAEVIPIVYEGSLQREEMVQIGTSIEAIHADPESEIVHDMAQWWQTWEQDNPHLADHKKDVVVGKGFRISSAHYLAGTGVDFEVTPLQPVLTHATIGSMDWWHVHFTSLTIHKGPGPSYNWGFLAYTTTVLPWVLQTEIPGVKEVRGITMNVGLTNTLPDALVCGDGTAFVSPALNPLRKSGTTVISQSLDYRQ